MNKISSFFIVMIISIPVFGQSDFEKYAKQQEQYMQDRESEFESYVSKQEKYIEELDKEFSEYLKQRWEEFQVYAGKQLPQKPKPKEQPTFKKGIANTEKSIQVSAEKITGSEKQMPDLPLLEKKKDDDYTPHKGVFPFYGTSLSIRYDSKFIQQITGDINETKISKIWDNSSNTNYSDLIKQLQDFKNQYNLNDWGYYMLTKKAAKEITVDPNASAFLQWFLLTKSNYIVKLGYNNNQLFLLVPSKNEIYEKPFFTYDNIKFYLLNGEQKNVFTYKKDFPEAKRLMDLNIYHPLKLEKNIAKTSYMIDGKKIDIQYNKNLIDFYNDYPLANIKVHFNAVTSLEAKESLIEQLQPILANKPETEAVKTLLSFIQSFNYQTDQEQFGREKFFFPDESLFYNNSDCEDRSVFFAYLIKELTGLKVIGLEYDDHVATAVCFNDKVDGDHFTYKGEKYVVCDPTFKNAPVGVSQPKYQDKKAKIIALDNTQHIAQLENKIWNRIIEAGGNHGSANKDITFDKEGNAYVTGYFKGTLNLGNQNYTSSDNTNDIFVAKFNNAGDPLWVKHFSGKGNNIGTNIAVNNDGVLFISGTFSGSLQMDDKVLKNDTVADVFIAGLDTRGNVSWAEKIVIEDIEDNKNVIFASAFDKNSGNNKWTRYYNESENFQNYGITFDEEGNPYLTGSLFATTSLRTKKMSYARYANFDPIESIKSRNDKLVADKYHPSVAGLFAVLNLIENSGISLPGSVAQKALDRYNPVFRRKYPSIYQNIGRIEFIRNSKGIIIVKTDNGGAVKFTNLKVNNDSKLKIYSFSSGNAQVDILSGVSIGKAFIWYDLNYIKLFKTSSNLVFDYDSDHTKKKINMSQILQ